MTTENFKDWLKTQIDVGDGIAVGTIDGNKPRFIGVYDGRLSGRQLVSVGGVDNTTYAEKQIKILIHWTNSAVESESKAFEVYRLLEAKTGLLIGDVKVYSVDPGRAPIPVGRDGNGIYEYTIEVKILHERN